MNKTEVEFVINANAGNEDIFNGAIVCLDLIMKEINETSHASNQDFIYEYLDKIQDAYEFRPVNEYKIQKKLEDIAVAVLHDKESYKIFEAYLDDFVVCYDFYKEENLEEFIKGSIVNIKKYIVKHKLDMPTNFESMIDALMEMLDQEIIVDKETEDRLTYLLNKIKECRGESKAESTNVVGNSVQRINEAMNKLPESIKSQDINTVLDAVKTMVNK